MIRLHLPAVPHTVTHNDFSHCAFTGKVLRFPAMMRSRGFEVYHYGVEGSDTKATEEIELFTKAEWDQLRIDSYKMLHPDLSIEDINKRLNDKKSFIGDLANWSTPLYRQFNERFRVQLEKYYRSCATDIVCLPFGRTHEDAISGLNVIAVETGIGYPDSYKPFRIFESYAHLHVTMALEKKQCDHYWFMIPNYYNILEWPLNLYPNKKKIGFFGRICNIKGCHIIVEIAKKFLDIDFIFCGQGDPTPYLTESSNIIYKPPIHGEERGEFLNDLVALIAPTLYIEPFCGVNVEAQLCGTPVITNEIGAFTETIEPFKTGMLCHTLADFCKGIQMALDGKFDRQYIHDRAIKLYDMYNVAKQYEYVFKNICDIHNGKKGWYSQESYIELLDKDENVSV
jgi:glycosyltransferase involved in cell wall biosynthesis